MSTQESNVRTHTGSCHCGAVRFEVMLDASTGACCNCSICTRLGAITGIVKPEAFRVVAGEDRQTAYEWGRNIAKRYFCNTCGITCYSRGYLEPLGGHYVSVNFNTLDDVDPSQVKLIYWDGRHNNWQAGPRDTPWPIFP